MVEKINVIKPEIPRVKLELIYNKVNDGKFTPVRSEFIEVDGDKLKVKLDELMEWNKNNMNPTEEYEVVFVKTNN